MNGSNLYRESTCVICVGLNRFEPKDYISRTLALDLDGTSRDKIDAIMEVEDCQIATVVSREYLGKQTHAGKLLDLLNKLAEGVSLSSTQIRDVAGLTIEQFKEAKKNKAVQDYFRKHIETTGSGKNTVYTKLQHTPSALKYNNICLT